MSKAAWQGRLSTTAIRYGESTPVGAVCCGACRTCASTNLVALTLTLVVGAATGVARSAKRFRRR
jgi:hypothetical protein